MPKTVLIIEDDPDTRTIYSSALGDRGYNVLTATQGAEGVHIARRARPELILMDIRMPVLDGWGAARYLRADSATRHIPICAISAYGIDEEDDEVGGRVELESFVMKPLAPRAVVDLVERHIGPPAFEAAGPEPPVPD
jgi:two-component system cell cycle response regulator DivK